MASAVDSKFRTAATKQVAQLGREIETLATENSQLRAEVDRLRAASNSPKVVSATSEISRNFSSSSSLHTSLPQDLLIAGDSTFPDMPIATVTLGDSNPLCVEAHPTNPRLVCIGSADKRVTLIDWTSSKVIGSALTSAPVLTVRFFLSRVHPLLVLIAGMDGTCHLVDFSQEEQNAVVLKWRDHDSYVLDARTDVQHDVQHDVAGDEKSRSSRLRCVTVSRDKSCVVSSLSCHHTSDDGESSSSVTWERVKERSFFFEHCVETAVFINPVLMECEEDLVVAERDCCSLIYCSVAKNTKRLRNMNERGDDHVSFNVLRLEISPSGKYILVSTDSHRLFVLGKSTKSESTVVLRNFYGHTADGMSTPRCVWSNDEKYVLSNAQKDCACYVWSVASERTDTMLNGHGRAVRDLSVSSSGDVCTVSYDKTLRVWSTSGKKRERSDESLAEESPDEQQQLQEQKTTTTMTTIPTTKKSALVVATVPECDAHLAELASALLSAEEAVLRAGRPEEKLKNMTKEKRALLKKTARDLRKEMKEWKRRRKEAMREVEREKTRVSTNSYLEDPQVTALIENPNDQRLSVFRNLKDANAVSRDGLFIVEGKEPIRLLLESNLEIHSLQLKQTIYNVMRPNIIARQEKRKMENESQQQQQQQQQRSHSHIVLPVYISTPDTMAKVAGFGHARGSFACGVRPLQRDIKWLRENVLRDDKKCWRVLGVDGCNNTANLGSLVRTATALGIDAILLSSDCCDPWYRQAVRVSMGHVFRTPIVRVESLSATLCMLQDEGEMKTWGAVIDDHVVRLKGLKSASERWCGIVGNEDKGMSADVREVCERQGGRHGSLCRIDMATDVDSMSITVAAGIFLNGLCERS